MTTIILMFYGAMAFVALLLMFIIYLVRKNTFLENQILSIKFEYLNFNLDRLEYEEELRKSPEAKVMLQESFINKTQMFSYRMDTIIRDKKQHNRNVNEQSKKNHQL